MRNRPHLEIFGDFGFIYFSYRVMRIFNFVLRRFILSLFENLSLEGARLQGKGRLSSKKVFSYLLDTKRRRQVDASSLLRQSM